MKKIISFLLVFGCCIAVWADFQVIGMTENNKILPMTSDFEQIKKSNS